MAEQPLGLVHGGPLSDFVKEAAQPLHLGNRVTAARVVADYLKLPGVIKNDVVANAVLQSFLQYLLDQQRYVDAATLLWTPNLFSGEPRSVKLLWDAVFQNVTVMVPGAASMGKSYNLGVWCYLDWRRDPEFTNIQLIGPSEKHLEKNLFSHIVKLHNNAAIPGPGEVRQLELTSDPKQKDSGIFGVVVPIGKKSAGRLQGVKVVQRPTVHAQFGPLSRTRVMIEEAENVPPGIWEDVVNIVSNSNGLERFKIFCPFNPKDPTGPCAQRCEPVGGFQTLDIETSERWVSKRGWTVVRLDGHKSENVVLGYEKFYGLQTKEGLEKVTQNAGGVGTPGYYTMARGWFPPTGVDLAVIPHHLTNNLFGTFVFVDTPRPCAGLDVALEGGDQAVYTLGRVGFASGYYPAPGPLSKPGEKPQLVRFTDPSGQPQTREVIQIDQIFRLPKGDTMKLVLEGKRVSEQAGVHGSLLGVDRPGNGSGVHDLLVRLYHGAVKGFNGSNTPSQRKIFEEDQKLPCDEYADLLSEAWYAVRKYIEYGFLKISPTVPQDPIVPELTGRMLSLSAKKTKVEPKKAYKSRGNKSPDTADSLTILVNTVRLNTSGPPSFTRSSSYDGVQSGPCVQRIGSTDRLDRL
jgi:hypothetical protein